MRSTTPPALSLIVAGVAALVFAFAQWFPSNGFHFLVVAPSGAVNGPLGFPAEWINAVRTVAATLGLCAAACGALALRWPTRAVAAIVGIALVLGAIYCVLWLVDPFPGADATSTWRWPAYASVIALADAALSA